jgi:hypothetical protein
MFEIFLRMAARGFNSSGILINSVFDGNRCVHTGVPVLLQGFGLHWVLLFHMSSEKRLLKGRPHMVTAVVLFGAAIFLMLSLHLAEVIVWVVALVSLGLIERAHDATYFCANAYTTLGYGNVDLAMPWRNIRPIIGIVWINGAAGLNGSTAAAN